ncbi:aspartate--tRNA ligase [bacterium BMS3Abin02]|nr:aspartate--tRNA ligase [bacterium BMS3Abin02]GBE21046.1 aspartate--tRNA ligase [bacterium BMS3Bbin01]HDH24735.1 aspartate--tRNA ligase [Actinomycetota bacterium]HDL49284.1 aspartate--tRNA ligase [Actinomycetota bacterium]
MAELDGIYRDAYAGEVTAERVGETVRLAGWVSRRRDHGGIVFIDLRDATGIVQAVIDPEQHAAAHQLKMEYVISAEGQIRKRPEGTENPDMATGQVEITVSELEILSTADTLPFMIDDRVDVEELIRLEYRYLDLRRPRMAANLRARSTALRAMREVLDERGFMEVDTPTLIRSTPEGARDMLVPSRLRKGSFYALPQSPQLFKQLLMVAGVDRYYQVARCYRDEDFRSDRQVEFTQLDVEGAFWGREGVFATFEAVIVEVVRLLRGSAPTIPFPRMTWKEVMDAYGTDKPDLRFGMQIHDLGAVFADSGFGVFSSVLAQGGSIKGINAGKQGLSRSGLDGLVERARQLGAKGLVWFIVEEAGLRSPVAKFLSEDERSGLIGEFGATEGDLLLLAADTPRTAAAVLGQLRIDLGAPQGHDELSFLWVTDFPVFEVGDGGTLTPAHHPFTAPLDVDEMRDTPETAISQSYDLVLNGSELGSGSVRIHDPSVQRQVFEILGITDEDAERRFGWFVKGLRFGTPPHAGFALGVDRLLALLQQERSIREVIPFPKTQTGLDPMSGSPTPVDDIQLEELGVELRPEVKAELGG